MKKLKIVLTILCSVVVSALVVYIALLYIPLTKTLEYNMQGYIIQPDGQISEPFPFTITGKEYDFILGNRGGEVSFSGDKLTKIEHDAHILYFNWDSAPFSNNYAFGHFTGDYLSRKPQFVYGTLYYYDPINNKSKYESCMLDLETGAFCMYADELLNNAFIIGVSDADTDPFAALESVQKVVNFPNWPSTPES